MVCLETVRLLTLPQPGRKKNYKHCILAKIYILRWLDRLQLFYCFFKIVIKYNKNHKIVKIFIKYSPSANKTLSRAKINSFWKKSLKQWQKQLNPQNVKRQEIWKPFSENRYICLCSLNSYLNMQIFFSPNFLPSESFHIVCHCRYCKNLASST